MFKKVKNMLIQWMNNVSFHIMVYSLLILQSASKQNGLLTIVVIDYNENSIINMNERETNRESILHVSTNRFYQLDKNKR